MYGVEDLRESLLYPHKGSEMPLISYEDPCRNRWGAIKLKLVQHQYGLNVNGDTIPELRSLYVDWRDAVELLPMRLTHKKVGYMNFKDTAVGVDKWLLERQISAPELVSTRFNDNTACEAVAYEYLSQSWINKKSVKRGNDVYISMLQDKFNPLFYSKNHREFFSTVLNSKRRVCRRTRMLYLTGTCDHAKVGDIASAWGTFGARWNHFITRVRDVFGKTAYIRTWQSQDNGYPHYHCLIYFFDFEFSAVYWEPDKSWRIHNRQKVVINHKTGAKDYCRDVFKDLWQWGHLDVKCCDNSKSALTDLLKYVLRDLEGGASDLTNTMVWYFQKKSFAVSTSHKRCMNCGSIHGMETEACDCGDRGSGITSCNVFEQTSIGFFELFGADGASLEPSDADSINAEGVTQEGTQEGKLVCIEIYPIIPREMMPYYQQLSLDRLNKPPDPPPERVEFLENFALSCAPASSTTRADGVKVIVYKYKDGFD